MNLNWYWRYFKTNSRPNFFLKRVLPLALLFLIILYRLQSPTLGGALLKNERKAAVPTKPAVLSRLDSNESFPMQEQVLTGAGFGEVIEVPTPRFPGTLSITDSRDGQHQVTAYILSWSSAEIRFVLPPDAPSGNLSLTFVSNGKTLTSNSLIMSVKPPQPHVTSISPESPLPAQIVTISGTGFGNTFAQHPTVPQAQLLAGMVTSGGALVEVKSWSDTQISVLLPFDGESKNLSVNPSFHGRSVASNEISLKLSPPAHRITGLSVSDAPIVSAVTISGSGFGTRAAGDEAPFPGSVFLGAAPLHISSWSDTSIVVYTPTTAATQPIRVVRPFGTREIAVTGPTLIVKTILPKIDGVSPIAFTPGSVVEIMGSNFGDAPPIGVGHFVPPGSVWFSEDSERNPSLAKAGHVISWSNNHIRVFAPLDIMKALIYIRLNSDTSPTSNVLKAKINSAQPRLNSIQPQLVRNASIVTIHGTNLGDEIKTPNTGHLAYPGRVYLNGLELIPLVDKWSANQISFYLPANASSGKLYYETTYGDKLIRSNSLELVVKNTTPILTRAVIDPKNPSILTIEGENLGYRAENPFKTVALPGRVFVDGVTTYPIQEWNGYVIRVDIGQLSSVKKVKVTNYQGSEVSSNELEVTSQ